jgi:hypothetical protein
VSTKIYNGWALPKLTLDELNDGLKLLRKDAQAAARSKQIKRQVSIATQIVDACALGNLKSDKFEGHTWLGASPWALSWLITSDKFHESEQKQLRIPLDDYSFKLQIIPTESKLLVLLYVDDRHFTEVFESKKWFRNGTIGFTPYPYWNNTDAPEDVRQEDWQARGHEWQDAIVGDIPVLNGFSVDCTGDFLDILNLDDIKPEELPLRQDRVAEAARNQALTQRVLQLNASAEGKTESLSRLFYDALDWMKTDEGKGKVLEAAAEVESKLPKEDLKLLFKQVLTSPIKTI